MDLARATFLFQEGRLRELLGIPAKVQGVQLQKAIRTARFLHHPDKGGDPKVASVVNAAADMLQEDKGCDKSYNTATFQQSEPTTATKLQREIEILKNTCQNAAKLLEACGEGQDCDKFCCESSSCRCSFCIATRLRKQREDLVVLIDWAVSHCPFWRVGTADEELLKQRLQKTLNEARTLQWTCEARAVTFEDLQEKQWRQEQQSWQGTKVTSEANESEERAAPLETPCANEPLSKRRPKKQRCAAQPEPQATTSADSASSPPEQQQRTEPSAEEQCQETPAETRPCVEEEQQNEELLVLGQVPAYFPRASAWLKQREPEKAIKLAHMWCEYRKNWNLRRMRIQRKLPLNDLDERATLLKQSAWQFVRGHQDN